MKLFKRSNSGEFHGQRDDKYKINYLLPWVDISGHDDYTARSMERELKKEFVKGNPLRGLKVRAIAKRRDMEDVLFALEDGTKRVMVVHLGWPSNYRGLVPELPSRTIYKSFELWQKEDMQKNAWNDKEKE
jgi:hypothetical protein